MLSYGDSMERRAGLITRKHRTLNVHGGNDRAVLYTFAEIGDLAEIGHRN